MDNVMNDPPAPAPILRFHHHADRAHGGVPRALAPRHGDRRQAGAELARTSSS